MASCCLDRSCDPLGSLLVFALQKCRSEIKTEDWLVILTPLKNMKVNWDDYFQYVEK